MWFKKSYKNSDIDSFESINMYDAFRNFYAKELIENPEDAKELTMFGNGTHYFHSKCLHHLGFFIDHNCSVCDEPIHKLKFWFGDEEFQRVVT
jgi:hypothetical protein